MSEQSRAFLSDRDHSLLIDIFYKLIGNSEDPAEVQSIESLIQMYEESGNGSEISDADVRHTISLVCKYCQMLSEQKHANDNLVDFYANSRYDTSRRFRITGAWKRIRSRYIRITIILRGNIFAYTGGLRSSTKSS